LQRTRLALIASTCLIPLFPLLAEAQGQPVQTVPRRATPAPVRPVAHPVARPVPASGLIQTIQVVGNQRIETEAILARLSLQPGDPFDPNRMDLSLKSLYSTGLFKDVQITRNGGTLVVTVAENPVINQIAFEGNHALNDAGITAVVQLKPRSVFTAAQAAADRQRILALYAAHQHFAATVEPKIIPLSDNRVDLVFEINDGPITLTSRIAFVGNHAFSEATLKEVITSRQQAWWRIFSTTDSYDAERVNYDKELLRKFYLKNGYVDFRVVDSTAELAPDRRSFFLTYVLDEGARYRVGKVNINSQIRGLPGDSLKNTLGIGAGEWYDGDAVDRTVTAMSAEGRRRGYAFVQVNPRVTRNPDTHTVDLVFDVVEGPRVYVERIDINGNTRTEDKVIRREFQFSEGDAFNADVVRLTQQRLKDTGYFNNVNMTSSQGSAPDRVIINTAVDEKATGELSLGGGFSTDIGALANVGLRERNLVGTGIDASINGILAQKETQIDLSVTDPYFLDRNLAAGFDLFHIVDNNQDISEYDETRTGGDVRIGYAFNDHLSQSWSYSLVQRDVTNIATTASIYIQQLAGNSSLSMLSTSLTLDYRDSRVKPHSGYLISIGGDAAGLGGTAHFLRGRANAAYYIPLDHFTGNSDWGVQISAGGGYLFDEGQQELIIDNFFLGGDNLRGFEDGGAGPHDIATGDSLGGRFLWTQSTELHYPLPISPDLGLSGRAFVDVGALWGAFPIAGNPITNSSAPRVGVGVGVAWNTPFGLINIDLADAVVKQEGDKTQVFRFGFGTSF
jgi:outer membrane protein insertion porin family